jgi:hypothetical protein
MFEYFVYPFVEARTGKKMTNSPFHGVELLLQYHRHCIQKDSCHHKRLPFDEDFRHNEV